MIEKIQLMGFQSWEDLSLKLHSGVNIIVGETEAGKSAIIRALRWTVFNQPSGESFRRRDSETTSSAIWLENRSGELMIERLRAGSSANQYLINEEEVYSGFGQTVPEDVRDALYLDTINFQFQHDSPFALSMSSAALARMLNHCVNLEGIDHAQIAVNQMLRESNKELHDHAHAIEALRHELTSDFGWIDEAEEDFSEMIGQGEKLEKLKRDCKALQEDVDHFTRLERKQTELKKDLSDFGWIEDADAEIKIIEVKAAKLATERADLDLIDSTEKRKETLERFLAEEEEFTKSLRKVFDEAIGDRCPLCLQPWKNKNHDH